jgi:MarR family transcriptional regulator, transcriptional regulator for hemolysin
MQRASAAETALAVDCVGRRLNVAARAARQVLEMHLARVGTTFAGYIALMALRYRGPLIQRQLADWLDIEGPTLSRRLERLEREGLITRKAMASDRRATLVELTPAGRERVELLEPIVADAACEVAAPLSTAQLEQLGALLDQLAGPRD